MNTIWILFLLLSPALVAALRDNYCERNETVRTTVPVTKQRTIVKPQPKWKLWKKSEKFTETYDSEEVQETLRLVRECCPGYQQLESGLCEPICSRACPAHASCAAPDRCECIAGYVSARNHHQAGGHYCEPICEAPCHPGAQCVAPNTCACREGYVQQKPAGDGVSGDCVPTCQVGDGCANGKCVAVERCSCNEGYRWDKVELRCAELSAESISEEGSGESFEDLSTSSTATFTWTVECPEDSVLFQGECREKQFESNEASCLKSGCGPHQTCLDSGICNCSRGYVPDETSVSGGTLSCQRTLLDQILGLNQATDDEDELNPWTIPIIGVASGALFVLLIVGFIGGKRYRQERTAAANKEMECQYSQKTVDVDEWVP